MGQTIASMVVKEAMAHGHADPSNNSTNNKSGTNTGTTPTASKGAGAMKLQEKMEQLSKKYRLTEADVEEVRNLSKTD
jgi:hypothetical protein